MHYKQGGTTLWQNMVSFLKPRDSELSWSLVGREAGIKVDRITSDMTNEVENHSYEVH